MQKLLLYQGYIPYAQKSKNGKLYVACPFKGQTKLKGTSRLWLLPRDYTKNSLCLDFVGDYTLKINQNKDEIEIFFAKMPTINQHDGLPKCDFLGNFYNFDLPEGELFMQVYAGFYWKNLLPQVAERTLMRKKYFRDGYVLSTLDTNFYAGTYPAVDHEFHIKGRLATNCDLDVSVAKRIIQHDLKIMKWDWKRQYRSACSRQPCGRKEYRVYRKSLDKSTRAIMFLLTANIEIIEEIYLYYQHTKDIKFVSDNIKTLQRGVDFIHKYIDSNHFVWSDVYYEDQVMKDGRTAQAHAFLANALGLLGRLYEVLDDKSMAKKYFDLSKRLAEVYVQNLPTGFWDKDNARFVDWIDRKGVAHDHLHLLANALPVVFNFADSDKKQAAIDMIFKNDSIFQKFPSFVAARIEDYTPSEQGEAGPYDLCAAGRYWCWDAAFRAFTGQSQTLFDQLKTVADEAKRGDFMMWERYDMDYVYYVDGKNAHGSTLYYEYPNVFIRVLVCEFFGFKSDTECDLYLCPNLNAPALVSMQSYGVAYQYCRDSFAITCLSQHKKTIRLNLTQLYRDGRLYLNDKIVLKDEIISIKPNQQIKIVLKS